MKTEIGKIYTCEYCNRKMLNKGSMSLHERMCKYNPKNRHKCFQYCRFLNKETDEGEIVFYCGNDDCDFSDKGLYSYKLERFEEGRERAKSMTRMPLTCEYYEIEDGHDEDYINANK